MGKWDNVCIVNLKSISISDHSETSASTAVRPVGKGVTKSVICDADPSV